ncbi:amidohydrolase family protein [Gordonia insulae]|uniref:N-substituted formamide deformylase n=1 Tax=Gordonia insulae TaxID=2420509 RepID=A0A3G8JT81_9ACTN|nr:amidohydrolase family protein [Gordonia insulae]AZG47732.1 N-substituted formamide deformylase [Gordonia insulae]
MLIRNADVAGRGTVDIRCDAGLITAVGADVPPLVGEEDLDVSGARVMPGLHDHHIHLRSLAATADSVRAGPPAAQGIDELRGLLRDAAAAMPPGTWLRGFGYHESVAGPLSRDDLDTFVADRPLRIQHRSGALWMLNGAACRAIGLDDRDLPGVERDSAGLATGRLWRMDSWLRDLVPTTPPDLGRVSRLAAARGVTGFTDATPGMAQSSVDDLAEAVRAGVIMQRVHCMSTPDIRTPDAPRADTADRFTLGPTKILLDDDRLPTLPELTATIATAHRAGKPVAVHCVTRIQLIITMTALEEAGILPGDRIEHGAMVPEECFAWFRDHAVPIITQPNFPLERAEQYRTEVPDEERPDLWRLGTLRSAGVPVAAGTDAPFGDPDPWLAIHAAATCHSGRARNETVSPAVALELFHGFADDPTVSRTITPGAPADLVVVRATPDDIRDHPTAIEVAATIIGGVPVHLA